MSSKLKAILSLVAVVVVFYVGFWRWMVCWVYVEPDEILVLINKLGDNNPNPDRDHVVKEGVKSVQADVYSEDHHFFSPLQYHADTASSVVEIKPDEVGIVKSMTGEQLKAGDFLAEEGQKGIQRRALTPGKYRLNPFAYEVHKVKATRIRPGNVGCVTRLTGALSPEGQLAEPDQRGIQKHVLQPGIYYRNPNEWKIDEV